MANNQQPQSDWKKRELGALWTKVAKKTGAKYLRGKLKLETGEINVMVFPTKEKRNENSPDFVIYLDDSVPQNSGGNQEVQAAPVQSAQRRTSYPPRQQQRPAAPVVQSTEQFL